MSDIYTNGRTLRERLLSRLIIDPSGCLLWTGPVDKGGYGYIWTGQSNGAVHRVMWETFVGPIPDGLVLDHVRAWGCVNRHCASVAHLEPVTTAENVRRAVNQNAVKTHCGTCGEPYDLINTYRTPRGKRDCRACIRDRSSRYKARKVAAS